MNAYITATAEFMPNEPVTNDDLPLFTSLFGTHPSNRIRRNILASNGIHTRHYAIDRITQEVTHTNARITAAAIERLASSGDFTSADITCLCCGTASPDVLLPGHASMVHGELGGAPCETVSFSGICGAGIAALKNAYLMVKTGDHPHAVATGSDIGSTFFRLDQREAMPDAAPSTSVKSFSTEFLKWMLSDGAGAVYVSGEPASSGLSLRIDWIDQRSYAHEMPTCMYAGGSRQEDGTLAGWREVAVKNPSALTRCFMIHQEVKLLNTSIIDVCILRILRDIIERRKMSAQEIDWFLPHYSSDYFREPVFHALEQIGFTIPEEKWFTNLSSKGNTGAASIFIIINELFRSGRIKTGQKLLCLIPESGRFSCSYMHLTAV